MTKDIITLANEIAQEKENIRQAIEARGVECGSDVPFAQYPGKIAQICESESGNEVFYGDNVGADVTTYTIPDSCSLVADGALSGLANLESCSMSSVSYIGNGAFSSDENLTSVYAPNLKIIGENAFQGCGFEEFSNDSVEILGNGAFRNAANLVEVNVPKVKVLGGSCFYKMGNTASTVNATIQKEINIPNAKVIGGFAISDINNLETLSVPGVETIEAYGVYNNANLTTLNNTANLKTLGMYALYGNNFSELDLSNVTSAGAYACAKSNNPIKKLNISSLKNIPANFYSTATSDYPSYLGAVDVVFNSEITSVGNYAFNGYGVPVPDLSKCVSIGTNAFSNCYFTGKYDLSSCVSIGARAFNRYNSSNNSTTVYVWLPSTCTSVGNVAFRTRWVIYTDAESRPSGWDSSFYTDYCTVNYGKTYEEFLAL